MNNEKMAEHTRAEKLEALGRVMDTLDRLRVECPWDRKQTNESLRPNTIEETYELCAALMADEPEEIRKELGDVLLHILFYAKIGSEQGRFDIADVADALNNKLIFRHPHVFGQVKADTAAEVSQNWEQIKMRERGGNKTVLSGVPEALPALIKAARIQEKAANVGFDWENREEVWKKVREEIGEFAAEAEQQKLLGDDATEAERREVKERMAAEMGDCLFALINASRLYGINPENALEHTNRKFIKRFNYIEQRAAEQGKKLPDMTLAEMDALWEEAKKQ